jgi:DNA-binding transcriptional regulator YdaS (Cro superfamily)
MRVPTERCPGSERTIRVRDKELRRDLAWITFWRRHCSECGQPAPMNGLRVMFHERPKATCQIGMEW